MILNFLGDSITEGVGASSYDNCFVQKVSQKLNCKVNNYGISGTRIAKQKAITLPHSFDMYFSSRIEFLDKTADFVFVFGGTNDYGHGDADLGDIHDSNSNTFCGAINVLIEKLSSIYAPNKICFILPVKRFNGNCLNSKNLSLEDYVSAIRKVLILRKINYIDLYNHGFEQPVVNSGDEYTADGLHPNDKGHLLIADAICKWILEYPQSNIY